MFRKRRQPAPFLNIPGAPFNPTTGQRAPLGVLPPKGTTLAFFQVIEDDTHDNYVVCRGYEAEADPDHRYLHDPYTVATTAPINVAKPYSLRGTFPYVQGQVIVAARIRGKLGYNPGKAATTVGQPADLDEEVELLLDDDDVGIAWLDIATPAETLDYDHCLAVWTSATLDPCPLSGDLVLSGRDGDVVMPSIAADIYAPDPADNSQFAVLTGTKTLYNPLPFTFVNGTGPDDYWCSHFGDGNFLLRGPTGRHIIGGSMPTTGTSLSGGFVVWLDGNSDGTGHGAAGPFVGRVFEVDSGTPTEIVITATGPCAYRVNCEVTVSGTSSAGTPSRITGAFTVAGTVAQMVGGSDQQMISDDAVGAAFTNQLNMTAIFTGDEGDTIKVSVVLSSGSITAVTGRITLEAILAR